MIETRNMEIHELYRFEEIDASETGWSVFRFEHGNIVEVAEEWHRPRWNGVQTESHIRRAAAVLTKGGVLLGAYDGDTLVGFALLRYRLTGDMAQLADLQVSKEYRRKGIARRLVHKLYQLAQDAGAREIYVSSCPSESAVGFYRSLGFEPARKVNEELYDLEPEDIHMTRML